MVMEGFVMSSMAIIRDFLAQKRIAVVGVSHNPQDFSRNLLRTLRSRGYDAVAVNPELTSVEDAPCFAHLTDVTPPVDGALVMTSPAITDEIVQECAKLCIPRVWMFRGGGKGSVSPQAIEFCEEHGIAVVPGECPYMFLEGESWFHRLHGFIKKIAGAYPS
jgi:predicted CoA-binding protein